MFLQQLTQSRPLSILARLTPPSGSHSRVKRVGRGPASGLGKTSGRGQKGQKARSSVPNWFEGGQTPIWKLFPKRGFYRHNKLELHDLNLSKIASFVECGKLNLAEGETLTMKHMKECGLISGPMKDGVSILAGGVAEDKGKPFKLNIKIEATKASTAAIEAIEKAGGSFTGIYFSKLGYRAHHSDSWFLENKGKIPLNARPIARRDIVRYSDEAKRGYLIGDDYVTGIKFGGAKSKKVAESVKSDLEAELEAASKEQISFGTNSVVSFSQLKI
ncbi:mitochondrial 54S ribosomal protein YmL10/YmL18 [Martiniozyma asiatica (nom. inval.)]|nr:mitochondrial 54S ribosomal protein YmL10/YmL18 [Martiniozyma asiatica]